MNNPVCIYDVVDVTFHALEVELAASEEQKAKMFRFLAGQKEFITAAVEEMEREQAAPALMLS